MRRLSFLLLLLGLFTAPARGQVETLLGEDVSYGGFGAAVLELSAVNGETAFIRGFRGGWIINFRQHHAVSLGLGFYTLENNVPADLSSPTGQTLPPLGLNYRGFETEYVYRSNKLIHLFVPLLIGSGSVKYEFARAGEDPREIKEDFFTLVPGVGAELNVLSWFRISGALSYRWVDGIEISGTSEQQLSNLAGLITFKVGWF